jgi:23S rRNA (guanosine2251-2'-O)-methyltransferase
VKAKRRRPSPAVETEILAGPHVVLEALRAGRRGLRRICLARQEQSGIVAVILGLARERAVPVEVRPRADLDRFVGGASHQGVLAEADPFPYVEAEDIVSRALLAPERAFVVVLDGIQDPQNLGAVLRTAEAAGAHGLILPRDRAAGITPAAARASAGATEHLPVARVTNLAAFLDWVKPRGVWVVGADPSGDRLLYDVDLRDPLALVIGAEGQGLRPLVKSRCDVLVRIPISGKVTSLNASCAAAVCVFEVIRQRQRATERGWPRNLRKWAKSE